MGKKWYLSKTLAVNILAIITIIIQALADTEIIGVELQVAILAILNAILRMVTKEPIMR